MTINIHPITLRRGWLGCPQRCAEKSLQQSGITPRYVNVVRGVLFGIVISMIFIVRPMKLLSICSVLRVI